MTTPHPGQDKYPDLIKPIEEHKISDDHTARVFAGGVTFTDVNDGHSVTISEWDLGNFVDAWFLRRLDEKYPEKKLVERYGK